MRTGNNCYYKLFYNMAHCFGNLSVLFTELKHIAVEVITIMGNLSQVNSIYGMLAADAADL